MNEIEFKGPCCACLKEGRRLRNLICITKRRPTPGNGWGCVVCGAPPDGAVAVICDPCLEARAAIVEVCAGAPPEPGRIRLEELREDFDHDLSKHPEDDY
jgi:hypothetical protein